MTGSSEGLPQAEVERLAAERDELAQRVEELEARPGRRRIRRIAAAILVVLSVVTFALAVPGVWARRTLGDTDRYVATVAPLAEDAAVQDYLARTVTTEVFAALDVEGRLDTRLSDLAPNLVFLAGPISDAVEGFVQDKVEQVFASDRFAGYWERANRLVHERVLAVLRGESEVVASTDGKVVISLLPLVNEALQAVTEVASELIGRQLDLPELTGEEVPVEAVARLEEALGIDLPDRFGTVTVYDSEELAAVQDGIELARRLMALLVVVFVLATAGALWASTRKRRTVIQLATALSVVLVLERRFAIAAANRIVDRAEPENRDAAQAVVDQVLGTLLRFTGWLLALALLALVVALLSGPYPWAVRLRGWVRGLGTAVAGAFTRQDRGAVGAWVGAHRDLLMLAGAALTILVFLVVDLTMGWFLVLALVLGVYEVVVYRLGAPLGATAAEP